MSRILIIEDEENLARFVELELKHEGYETDVELDGRAGLDAALNQDFDVILLDLMLPELNGIEVARRVREVKDTPIIIMTARDSAIDRVSGLDHGADDYIVKPFSMRELCLRIRAILRRCEGEQVAESPLLSLGDIIIDRERHRVVSADVETDLTSTEFKLLLYLVERRGRVISRDQLLQDVWSYHDVGDTRTVDTHITRLRGKLGAPGEQIKTVRGFGYKIEEN